MIRTGDPRMRSRQPRVQVGRRAGRIENLRPVREHLGRLRKHLRCGQVVIGNERAHLGPERDVMRQDRGLLRPLRAAIGPNRDNLEPVRLLPEPR